MGQYYNAIDDVNEAILLNSDVIYEERVYSHLISMLSNTSNLDAPVNGIQAE